MVAQANRVVKMFVQTKKKGKLGEDAVGHDEYMKSLALSAIDDDEVSGLKFVLGNGRRIDPEKIKIEKKVRITKTRNVFDYFDAKLEVLQFYDDLKASGYLS